MTVSFDEDPVDHLLTVHFGLDRDFIDALTDADLVAAHDRDHTGCLAPLPAPLPIPSDADRLFGRE